MTHLFIRPESKPKDKLGRGSTIVAYSTINAAAYQLLVSLVDSHSYTADEFQIHNVSADSPIQIEVFNEHDYYRWLDVINSSFHYIEILQPNMLEPKAVIGNPNAYRYHRESLEALGYEYKHGKLVDLVNIELVRRNVPEEVLDPILPLVEIDSYGDLYDLPINTGVKSLSILDKVVAYFSSMFNSDVEEPKLETRSPYIVFESHLGGTIAIYSSVITGKEVDVAFFSGSTLVNVFSFQDGSPHVYGLNGLTIEDLISIGTWRILHLNSVIAAEENLAAAHSLNAAIHSLNIRGKRQAREAALRAG